MARSLWSLVASVLFVGSLAVTAGCEMTSGKAQLSPAAAEAIHKAYPQAVVKKVKVETEDGVKIYEAKLLNAGAKMEVTVTDAGVIMEVETPLAGKDLPKAVADAVAAAAPGAKVEKAARSEMLADPKLGKLATPKVTYEVEVVKDGADGEITLAADGKVLEPLKMEKEEKEAKDKKDGKSAKGENGQKGQKAMKKSQKDEEDEDGDDDQKDAKDMKGEKGQNGERGNKDAKSGKVQWKESFTVDKTALADAGKNPYFILQPGYKLVYQDGRDTLTITVLDETKVVDGVKTRVVEERETKDGQLAEVSRNYFAIDAKTSDVYYFGEDVDMYKDGKVADHGGTWLSGVNGAKFGMMMPGEPKVGDKFFQERAPEVAMDRSEIVSLSEEMKTPAGAFKKVMRVKDGSALEPKTEDKWYAPGVGLLKDGGFVLSRIEGGK